MKKVTINVTSISAAFLFLFFTVNGLASAATTISTDITTGGVLTVSSLGTSTFSGFIDAARINISGNATSTASQGFNITNGCFAVNGTCVGTGGGNGSGTVNSGTSGNVAFYDSSGTAVSGTSTIFISSNGNVGIGTTTPSKLSVYNSRTEQFNVLSDGRIQAGNYDPSDENIFHFQRTIVSNPYSSNRYFLRSTGIIEENGITDNYGYGAVLGKMIAQGTGTYNLIEGVYGYANTLGAANVAQLVGGRMISYHDGSGLVTNNVGMLIETGARSDGNITSNAGIKIKSPDITSTGTITDSTYGIYIENQNFGIGQKYSIFTAGTATSSFGGAIGIGTTSPKAKIGIQGGIGVNEAQLYLSANSHVGIGTTTPVSPLHIYKNITESVGSDTELLTLTKYAFTDIKTGTAFHISFNLPDNDNPINELARLTVGANDNAVENSGYLSLYTANSGVLAEKFRITSVGNVGIGTTTPTTQLHVTNSSSNSTTTVTIGKTGQNKGTCLELFDAAGTPVYAYVAPGATTFTLSATSCK